MSTLTKHIFPQQLFKNIHSANLHGIHFSEASSDATQNRHNKSLPLSSWRRVGIFTTGNEPSRSQISSQSLNEVYIYWLLPNRHWIRNKRHGEFFSYNFVFVCQFESAHVALWRLTRLAPGACVPRILSLSSCSPSWWSGLLGVVPSLDGLHPASSMDPILLHRIPARTWSEQCMPSADTPGGSSVGSVGGSQVLIPLSYRCLRCGWTISSRLRYAHQGMGYVGLASGLLHQGRRERRTWPLKEHTQLLLRMSAVIGRYGPHLMIMTR